MDIANYLLKPLCRRYSRKFFGVWYITRFQLSDSSLAFTHHLIPSARLGNISFTFSAFTLGHHLGVCVLWPPSHEPAEDIGKHQ